MRRKARGSTTSAVAWWPGAKMSRSKAPPPRRGTAARSPPADGSGWIRRAASPGRSGSTDGAQSLFQTPVATAVLNLDLNLTGPLARDPRVSGRIEVVSLDITVPERLPATLRPLPGTKHLHAPRTAVARLALQSKTKTSGQGASRYTRCSTSPSPRRAPSSSMAVVSDAELGGSLRLSGTLTKPSPIGAFSLETRTLQHPDLASRVVHGNITFAGISVRSWTFLPGRRLAARRLRPR